MKPQTKITIEIDVSKFHESYTKDTDSGCWNWDRCLTRGYGKFKGFQAQRISWMIHKGHDPIGFYVLHTCDNRKCVNPDHLYLGTQSDNMKDMWRRKRREPNYGMRKHSQETIDKIRETHKTGDYSFAELGRMFGMNRSMIYKIVNELIWKS